jgi:hypothetical protein
VKETLDLTRETVENKRRVLVSGSLPLSSAEAAAFWPLYDAYEKERRRFDERASKLVTDFLNSPSVSGTQAKTMLAEALEIDEGRALLRRSYFERMAKAVPARLVVRLYQIENKLDSVVRADLARQIPLAP